MSKSSFRVTKALLVGLLPVFMWATPALAHEHRDVNGASVTVGWDAEPAFTGYPNAAGIQVDGPDGEPIKGLELKTEVLFGGKDSTAKTEPMDMEPSDEEEGHYSAPFVPTRFGNYTFQITGTVLDKPFDQVFTSGESTFEPVEDPEMFPAMDPSTADLSQRMDRLGDKVDNLGSAQRLGIIGVALGALGVAIGVSNRNKLARRAAYAPPDSTEPTDSSE